MEQYFITLHSFTFEEYEVWRQLNKHCNYDTNISGYTVNQLVINSLNIPCSDNTKYHV